MEDTIILYGTYSANKIDEVVDAINQLTRNLTRYERMLGHSQLYGYKDNSMERKIVHMILNSHYIYMTIK